MHAKSAASVLAAVTAVLRGGHLTLSQLARTLESTVAVRHRIKRMDRLLGNGSVHRQRFPVYQALATRLLSGMHTLLIVVDWSDMTEDQDWHLLRASVVVEGRSITLYEDAMSGIILRTAVWYWSGKRCKVASAATGRAPVPVRARR